MRKRILQWSSTLLMVAGLGLVIPGFGVDADSQLVAQGDDKPEQPFLGFCVDICVHPPSHWEYCCS